MESLLNQEPAVVGTALFCCFASFFVGYFIHGNPPPATIIDLSSLDKPSKKERHGKNQGKKKGKKGKNAPVPNAPAKKLKIAEEDVSALQRMNDVRFGKGAASSGFDEKSGRGVSEIETAKKNTQAAVQSKKKAEKVAPNEAEPWTKAGGVANDTLQSQLKEARAELAEKEKSNAILISQLKKLKSQNGITETSRMKSQKHANERIRALESEIGQLREVNKTKDAALQRAHTQPDVSIMQQQLQEALTQNNKVSSYYQQQQQVWENEKRQLTNQVEELGRQISSLIDTTSKAKQQKQMDLERAHHMNAKLAELQVSEHELMSEIMHATNRLKEAQEDIVVLQREKANSESALRDEIEQLNGKLANSARDQAGGASESVKEVMVATDKAVDVLKREYEESLREHREVWALEAAQMQAQIDALI